MTGGRTGTFTLPPLCVMSHFKLLRVATSIFLNYEAIVGEFRVLFCLLLWLNSLFTPLPGAGGGQRPPLKGYSACFMAELEGLGSGIFSEISRLFLCLKTVTLSWGMRGLEIQRWGPWTPKIPPQESLWCTLEESLKNEFTRWFGSVWFFGHLVCNYTVITRGTVCTGCSCPVRCGFHHEH